MPTTRRYLRRPHRAKLTHAQEIELWLGPRSDGSSFVSDEHRRVMWFRHRGRFMQLWAKGGRRPMGWWLYESPFRSRRHPGTDHERSILYEFSDVLSADERAELEAEWRREFDRSWDEHFFYCAGPDKIYSGDDARWQHWLWADLPPPLLDRWMAERQRRSRVVRELQDESQQAETVAETGNR
jgi:hypothetical protein